MNCAVCKRPAEAAGGLMVDRAYDAGLCVECIVGAYFKLTAVLPYKEINLILLESPSQPTPTKGDLVH